MQSNPRHTFRAPAPCTAHVLLGGQCYESQARSRRGLYKATESITEQTIRESGAICGYRVHADKYVCHTARPVRMCAR